MTHDSPPDPSSTAFKIDMISKGNSAVVLSSCVALFGIYVYSTVKWKRGDDEYVIDDDDGQETTKHLPSHVIREQMKEKRRQAKIPELAMKKQMYDNINMTDQHGELLCKISTRKAKWYVTKGLAHFNGDRTSIQLKFKPKDKSNRGENTSAIYTKAEKANVCVSCGHEEHHQRFYICPYAYRSLMPQRYKSHQSHDIVILCHHCHLRCEQFFQEKMREIEDEYEPPLGYEPQFEIDTSLRKVRSSALALMNWSHKIPKEKLEEHDRIVRGYLKLDVGGTLTTELLQSAIDVNFRIENKKFVSKPQVIVNAIAHDEEKLTYFIKGWRQHFIDTVHPRFMPQGWSVDNPVACDLRDN